MSGVASSWSRRRAAVAKEAALEAKAVEDAALAQEHAELAEKPDDEILKELGLPDPESLVHGDDFKAFLSKAVPQHLRKRALRTLWRSNPVLACVDGLNDYDDDYLTGSTGQGALKTTYQVGKGMLAHVLEVERQAAAKAAPVEAEEDVADVAVAEVVEAGPEVAEQVAPVAAPQADVDDAALEEAPAPRRMQFQFEEDRA